MPRQLPGEHHQSPSLKYFQLGFIAMVTIASLIYIFGSPSTKASSTSSVGAYTGALSNLKQFKSLQITYSIKEGEGLYIETLKELNDKQALRLGFFEAWAGHAKPQPMGGYLYTEILPEDDLDRIGLCAYPADPNSKANMLLILIDDGPSTSIWTIPYQKIKAPIIEWPDYDDLEANYGRLDRSIQEGTNMVLKQFKNQ